MGNLTLKPIEFRKVNEIEKFFFHIEVTTHEIINDKNKIKEKILNLETENVSKYIFEILKVIDRCIEDENEKIIEQIDYYLFYSLNNKIPLLSINNIEAKQNQKKNNTNSGSYFCKEYNL